MMRRKKQGTEIPALFRYSGMSPFEVEAKYSTLNGCFEVSEDQLPETDPQYVTTIEIEFPLPYDESFFQLFTFERWFKIKGIIKEMKRRRGMKGVKTSLSFYGALSKSYVTLKFLLMNKNNRDFEVSIEKIEYLVDLINVQLQMLPADVTEVIYCYDEIKSRWNPDIAISENQDNYYFFKDSEWKKTNRS